MPDCDYVSPTCNPNGVMCHLNAKHTSLTKEEKRQHIHSCVEEHREDLEREMAKCFPGY